MVYYANKSVFHFISQLQVTLEIVKIIITDR